MQSTTHGQGDHEDTVEPRQTRTRRKPLTAAVLKQLSEDQQVERHYDELVMIIADEARTWLGQLDLPCFPLELASASVHQIVDTYGPAIRAKLRGATPMQYKTCLDYWQLFTRILEAALEAGGLTITLVIAFSKTTGKPGDRVAACLRWAANAFGCDVLRTIAEHKIVHARI